MSSPAPPSRLPPNQAERVRVVADRSVNLRGGTRWGRGTTQTTPRAASTGGDSGPGSVDRFTVYRNITASGLSGSHLDIATWDGVIDDNGGDSIGLLDDGGISLNAEGVYAVTISLYAGGGEAAAATMMAGVLLNSPFNNAPTCFYHGGEGAAGFTPHATGSGTQYTTGGTIYATLVYSGLDPAVPTLGVDIDVVRVR